MFSRLVAVISEGRWSAHEGAITKLWMNNYPMLATNPPQPIKKNSILNSN